MSTLSGRYASIAVLVASVAASPALAQLAPAAPQMPAEPKAGSDEIEAEQPPLPPLETLDGGVLPPEIRREIEQGIEAKTGSLAPEALERAAPEAVQSANPGGIVVSGQRPRNSALSNIPPERTLSATDIRALGAGTVAELVNVLGSQVASDRGREGAAPQLLLNGRRVLSFLEVAQLPTEAIERVDILPEDVALSYGISPGQKLVNIVTFALFQTQIGNASVGVPTEGGAAARTVGASFLRIRENARVNVDALYEHPTSLFESDRNIIQVPTALRQASFRSLLPEVERLSLNGALSLPLSANVNFTSNARVAQRWERNFLGASNTGAITLNSDVRAITLTGALNGMIGKWLWTFTGGHDDSRSKFTTNNVQQFPFRAASKDITTRGDILLNGVVFNAPAGPVTASVRGSIDLRVLNSTSVLSNANQQFDAHRTRLAISSSLDLPLTSTRMSVPVWLGSLSLNANGRIERLSDFGAFWAFGYGLRWSPAESLSIVASETKEAGAPSLEQLASPVITTPSATIYDFLSQQTVDAVRAGGGNPALTSDRRDILSLAIYAAPFPKTDLKFRLAYTDIRVANPILSIAIATRALQNAFPDRFERDSSGRLSFIDTRPANFYRSEQRQVRWGFDWTRPLDKTPAWLQGAKIRAIPSGSSPLTGAKPNNIVIQAKPGGALARSLDSLSSRLTLSFSHLWGLEDTVTITPGAPALDLLGGSAIDQNGGRSRHEFELQAGVFKGGKGARLTLRWRTPTAINDDASGSGLRFIYPLLISADAFLNLESTGIARTAPFLKGARVGFTVTNLLNDRVAVRHGSGTTPLGYQPAFFDSLGRVTSVNFRIRF